MKNPQFASGAAEITERLSHISNPAMRTQMTVPVIMSHILPIGIKGCFCAIMLFLMVTTDVSYLHSWGSIFVQDVILPLRKKPFTPEQQIRAIRWSIVSVALFAFIFSITYRPTTYILMFFALTGTIYLGGAGACITGGLYWKRGTTAGAWGAMIAGMIFAIIGFFGETFWKPCVPQFIEWFPNHAAWLTAHADRFPINGQILWGMAMAVSITLYITLSLITCREPFNMDRMLHRGKYAIDANGQPLPPVPKEKFTWRSFIGIDSEMTIGDKRLTYFAFSWNYFWWIVGMTTFVWQGAPFLAQKFPSLQTVIFWQTWPVEWYTNWFFITTYTTGFGLALVTTVWFTWGSLRDLFRLFDRLRSQRANLCDDGRVIGHHNADETLSDLPATDRPSEK
jgi:SSS family solute:Na+ symporter